MDIELLEILNGFQAKCDELLSAADYRGSQLIYHFTSISNLEHIISKRQLLFTDYRDLNDCLEIQYGKNTVLEILSTTIKEKVFSERLTSFIQEDNFIPYISSFSTDINNLALWRFYADDGLGVAIGFDPQIPMDNESIEEAPLLAKVFYGKDEIEKIIQKLKKRITIITKSKVFQGHSDKDRREFHRQVMELLATNLNILFLVTKDRSFHMENEVRLILSEGKLSKSDTHPEGFFFDKDRKKSIKCKKRRIHITDDLEIKEESFCKIKRGVLSNPLKKDCIKEIWIGPRCSDDMVEKLSKMIEKYSMVPNSIIIKKFESPYTG